MNEAVDSLRRSSRRLLNRSRATPALLLAFLVLPVPLWMNDEWWFAPVWTTLHGLKEVYEELESVALTVLLSGVIIAQAAIWSVLASTLGVIAATQPHSRLARICASRRLLLGLLALLVFACLVPVYWLPDADRSGLITLTELR